MSARKKWGIFFQHWDVKRAPVATAAAILLVLSIIGGAVGGVWWLLFL